MRNRRSFHRTLLVLSVYCLSGIAAAGSPSGKNGPFTDLTVTGSNEFRFADGSDITYDYERPWNYLINSSDIRIGIRRLYTKLRFDVEEPSMGFNPPEPVHREYLSRRTLGLEGDFFTIEAGHVSTQFGRGLTLSCKEDREVEQYSILDGVFGQMRQPLMTLQAIAGRPYQWRNNPFSLITGQGSRSDTLLVQGGADLRNRDMVAGVNAEFFAPVYKLPLPLLSSGSIGGGVVRYATDVGPPSLAYHDAKAYEEPFWYQNRKELYLPSLAGNLAAGDYGISVEYARMTGKIHRYTATDDTVRGAFDSVYSTPHGSSSYISATARLFEVTLLAEYKNYAYDRTGVFSKEISSFLVPPNVRYTHSWHLLTKHLISNLMADALGYNVLVNWSPLESALVTADVTYGGRHDGYNRFRPIDGSVYWEAYGEWSQEIGDLYSVKLGFNLGRLDPEQQRVTFRTLAGELNAGPFAKRHSFGLTIESQLNDKPFLAEKNPQALKALIARTLPADSLIPYVVETTGETIPRDTLRYDYLVPDNLRSQHTQYAFNLLATLSYGFSPWISVALTFEHETGLEKSDFVHIVSELASPKKNYASIGISIKPSDNHVITVEYGSMSGGKKCTLGTCVDLPPFRGLKVTVVSRF